MPDFHSVIRALKSRSHVEKNLNAYIGIVKNNAFRFALVDLSLKSLSMAEAWRDSLLGNEDFSEAARLLSALTSRVCPEREKIASLRDENISRMQRLTDDVDIYSTNEYMLNRVEYRFKENDLDPENFSDRVLTEDLLHFLSLKENEEQNLYTVRLIEQLPVRMTKNRFLEVIARRLTIYRGTDKNAFEEAMMMLRSASGLNASENERLNDVTKALSETPVREITKEGYEAAFNAMTDISSEISGKIDLFQLFQEVLNDLLSVSLSYTGSIDFPEKETCLFIIQDAASVLLGEKDSVSEESYASCMRLEGLPETFLSSYHETEGYETDVLSRYPRELETFGLVGGMGDILKLSRLLSNSLYASLEAEENTELSEESYIGTVGTYLKAVREKLDHVTIPYGRAVMARIFTQLPPRFTSQEELETYIYDSLRSCSDAAEKKGTVELLHQIMEE